MRNGLSITVVGLSLTVLFAVTYVLAVIFCLVAAAFSPTSGMMTGADTISNMMQAALPGFGWHVVGFFIGLLLAAVLRLLHGSYLCTHLQLLPTPLRLVDDYEREARWRANSRVQVTFI
jgi:hypothetical protein